jgi:enoyl-CoA hydratase/carnithine racemase
MSTVSDFLLVERRDDLWTVRFRPLDFMMFQRLEANEAIFALLDEAESKHVKVIRADYPAGSLSPAVVEQFWEDAQRAPVVAGARHEPPLPALVRNASTAIPRLIKQLRRITTLYVTSFQGEVDLDLFGLALSASYRVCADDTVIVNRVLERDAGPGSAIFWLLTRYLGFGMANHLLMEGKSLTAQEALDLRLVNRVVSAADLESEAAAIAEQFAAKPSKALASLVRASNHLDTDLATYLERIGSGFSF